jgi:hypothetical protein
MGGLQLDIPDGVEAHSGTNQAFSCPFGDIAYLSGMSDRNLLDFHKGEVMNEKVLEALKVLATKLGTTVELLWAVLLRQARIEFFTDIFIIFVVAFSCWLLYNTYQKLEGKWGANEERGSRWDDHSPISFALWAWAGINVILVIIALFSISGIIAEGFNPEYWALKRVFELLSGPGC